MTLDLHALSVEAHDPEAVATFWSGLLGWERAEGTGAPELLPDDDTGFRLRFLPSEEPKRGPNQMHVELTSLSLAHQQATVDRVLALGGRHLDIGQGDVEHVVMGDPEGNELCVIEPGNRFLADCGFLGAVSSDGTQAVGYFWSQALGWPLVWDQDEETAVRAPYGGPKVTWGGPPVAPKLGRNRLHLDLAPEAGGDRDAEVERLLASGATLLDQQPSGCGGVGLADPDGNELCVLSAAESEL